MLTAIACTAIVTGCGDDDSDANSGPPATSPTPSESTPTEPSPSEPTPTASESSQESSPESSPAAPGTVIEITFEGDTVTPNGDRVEAKAGEPITLEVTADEAGEIHVHSNPEQEIAYDAGQSTLTLTIDQPGIVEVESHHLDKVIVQLEVRP